MRERLGLLRYASLVTEERMLRKAGKWLIVKSESRRLHAFEGSFGGSPFLPENQNRCSISYDEPAVRSRRSVLLLGKSVNGSTVLLPALVSDATSIWWRASLALFGERLVRSGLPHSGKDYSRKTGWARGWDPPHKRWDSSHRIMSKIR